MGLASRCYTKIAVSEGGKDLRKLNKTANQVQGDIEICDLSKNENKSVSGQK